MARNQADKASLLHSSMHNCFQSLHRTTSGAPGCSTGREQFCGVCGPQSYLWKTVMQAFPLHQFAFYLRGRARKPIWCSPVSEALPAPVHFPSASDLRPQAQDLVSHRTGAKGNHTVPFLLLILPSSPRYGQCQSFSRTVYKHTRVHMTHLKCRGTVIVCR